MRKNNSLNKNWKNIKLIKRVFDIFGHDNIFLVGGVIRNSLLKQKIGDIDLTIKLNFTAVKKKLIEEGINFIDLSKGHGTVTLLSNENSIEITSMRVDKETFGRKAKVEFVNDIYLDSCRRDFTINSIYSNFTGDIYDPHNGTKDLEKRKVKFIGEPIQRIKEDKLRVLRYYRFLAYYGCKQSNLDKESMIAIKKSSNLIANISKERKSYEFFRLIIGNYAAEVLILMKKHKVLKLLFPSIEKLKDGDLIILNDLKVEKLIRISYLLITSRYQIDKLKNYLIFRKKEYNYLSLICSNFQFFEMKNVKEARLAKYKLGYEISLNIYYLKCFIKKANMEKRIKNVLESWEVPVFPINGHDLKEIGITKGNVIGTVLKETKDWWIEKDFKPNKNQCLYRSKLIFF